MKKIVLTLLIAGLACASGFAQKILTFDSSIVTEKFQRMQVEEGELKKQQEAIQTEQAKLEQELVSIKAKFDELVLESQKELLTEDARRKAREYAEAQAALFREKQAGAQQYLTQRAQKLQQDVLAARQKYMKEVRDTAKEIATEKGAGLVLESNPNSAVIFYNSGTSDITEELVKKLNDKK